MKVRLAFWTAFLAFVGFRIGFPPFPPEALDPQLGYHYLGMIIGAFCGVFIGLLMQRLFGKANSK